MRARDAATRLRSIASADSQSVIEMRAAPVALDEEVGVDEPVESPDAVDRGREGVDRLRRAPILQLVGRDTGEQSGPPPTAGWSSESYLCGVDLKRLATASRGDRAADVPGAQVWEWTARGVDGYDAMTNLPLALRHSLAEQVPFSTLVRRDGADVDATGP